MVHRSAMVALALCLHGHCTAQSTWVEDFENGVGRFDTVSGPGATDFVHDPALGALDAFFERRDATSETPSRRLALLDRIYTEADDASFSVEWTPLTGAGGYSWPLLGFFDSTTRRDVGVVRVRDNNFDPYTGTWETSLYFGPGGFNFNATENEGFLPWTAGETYRLDFSLAGSTSQMSFEVSRIVAGSLVSQGSATWDLPGASWSFDAVGLGNLLDDHGFGASQRAIIDNFSFAPAPATVALLGATALCTCRRRRVRQWV